MDIKLQEGQNGYDVIGEYVQRYWKRHGISEVIISLGTSYDGQNYVMLKEIVFPECGDDILFNNDWWEGEKYLKIYGIVSIDDIDITGGIYPND